MVPTNEERYEVAARLRETMLTEGAAAIEERKGLDPAVAARFVAIPNLAAALNFDKAIVSMRELTDRLADLIEPGSEHTCRNIATNVDDFCYSKCNAFVKGVMINGFDYWYPIGKALSNCPNCGAKVVE